LDVIRRPIVGWVIVSLQIGWHNDSGFLTALAGDLYVDHETGDRIASCPDPAAGLYVVNRKKRTGGVDNDQSVALRVVIPHDCVAVQVGECTQIVTGGAIQATPHCVRGCSGAYRNVARISLPCFVDTKPTFPLQMPPSCTREQVLSADCSHNKVPPLAKRWRSDGITFGDFLQTTFAMYYNWKA
jgi:isopenicillin N synthase-like dioxygenase